MPCYHPLPAIRKRGENTYHIGREGDVWEPYTDYQTGEIVEPIKIPCGKCIGCRLDYSRTVPHRPFTKPTPLTPNKMKSMRERSKRDPTSNCI